MSLFEKIILPIGTKPASGWVKWRHRGIPDEEGAERELARNNAELDKHCKVCTVLSGCYFPSFNMPKYPQHEHCDCMLASISNPNSQAVAFCAVEKFSGYVFDPENSDGKTELFVNWGYSIEDSEFLKSEFEEQARKKYLSGNYTLNLLDKYGQRITISITLKNSDNNDIIFKTGWMVHPLGLITCSTPFSGVIK